MKTQLQRMEALAKAMTELMSGAKAQLPAATGSATGDTTERQKKRAEARRKKFENAIACTHCNRKHPSRTDDKCWELEANAADRPANWKSVKST